MFACSSKAATAVCSTWRLRILIAVRVTYLKVSFTCQHARHPLVLTQCMVIGGSDHDTSLLGGITNATVRGFDTVLPASQAEVRANDAVLQAELATLQATNANLTAEVVDLQAEQTQDQATLSTVISQVNKLTPVSISTTFLNLLLLLLPVLCRGSSQLQALLTADALQGYNGTNGLNGINGTTGPAGFTGVITMKHRI